MFGNHFGKELGGVWSGREGRELSYERRMVVLVLGMPSFSRN